MDYPIVLVPLSDDDGGGFQGFVPDLVGCMSDGDTRAEALKNTEKAIIEWIDEAKERGLSIPQPGTAAKRAHAERAALLRAARDAMEGVDHLETRLENLEKSFRELEAEFDHNRAWVRFAALTGQTELPIDKPRPSLS